MEDLKLQNLNSDINTSYNLGIMCLASLSLSFLICKQKGGGSWQPLAEILPLKLEEEVF